MIERRNTPELVNSKATLNALAERARSHYRKSIESWMRCAAAIAEARDICDHGQWLPWLESVGVGARTAQRMIRVARSDLEMRHVTHLGIKGALDYLQLVDDVAEADATLAAKNVELEELRERVAFLEDLAIGTDGGESQTLNAMREVQRSQLARINQLQAREREIADENEGLRRHLKEAA